MLYRPSPMLLVIAIIAFPQLLAAWRYDPSLPENQAYYGRIPPGTKFEYTALYLGLVVLLSLMVYNLHAMRAGVHGGEVD